MAGNTRTGVGQTALAGILPYRYLAGFTLSITYVVMILGAYTGAIGAGLSCPDWPTCHGTWIPWLTPEVIANSPYTQLQIFAEWIHRGLAMVAGILILGTALAAWRVKRDSAWVRWSATVALLLLPLQVVLGGLTVTRLLQPVVVTSHLATAVLILVMLTTTYVASVYESRRGPRLV